MKLKLSQQSYLKKKSPDLNRVLAGNYILSSITKSKDVLSFPKLHLDSKWNMYPAVWSCWSYLTSLSLSLLIYENRDNGTRRPRFNIDSQGSKGT